MNRRRILLQGLKTQRNCIKRLQIANEQGARREEKLQREVKRWEDRMLALFRCDMSFQHEQRTRSLCLEISERALMFAKSPEALFSEALQQLVTKLYRSR